MKIKDLVQISVLAASLILILISTNPYSIPLALLLVPYLLSALIFYKLAYSVVHVFLKNAVSTSKVRLYALILTVLLTNFALLKSIGQLTVQDGLISGCIVVVSVVYISKFSLNDRI